MLRTSDIMWANCDTQLTQNDNKNHQEIATNYYL